MTTQRPRWSEPAAAPEEHPADAPEKLVKNERSHDRKWPWPYTLRLAILISGAFWLLVAAAIWAYWRAG